MRKDKLKELINFSGKLDDKINFYIRKRILRKQEVDVDEIMGHIKKVEHNLRFIQDNLKIGYFDWCITGCYYAVYHAVLALILKKEYSSKNHDATLCVLIKEYYKKGINEEDIELINKFFLDYQDLLFYVQTKRKREEATYSSKYLFDEKYVEKLRLKTIDFVNKAKEILNE